MLAVHFAAPGPQDVLAHGEQTLHTSTGGARGAWSHIITPQYHNYGSNLTI